MKVMCIDDNWEDQDGKNPVFSEVVTVVACDQDTGGLWYHLLEYPYSAAGRKQSFTSKKFAPTSEIDETELVEQRLITA
jgi:hypothetical protein